MAKRPTTRDLLDEAAEVEAVGVQAWSDDPDPDPLAEATRAQAAEAVRLREELDARLAGSQPKPPDPAEVAKAQAEADAAYERAQQERLPPVKQPGQGDPPVHIPKPKRLTIVELDGRESVIDIDPYNGGFLMVETFAPRRNEPWAVEPVHARIGILSIANLELVDVEEKEE